MLNLKKLIPIIAVVLIALGVNLEQFGIDLGALTGNGSNTGQKQWSSTKPEINLWHIFDGEINRKGKPVGFHSRPNGQDPANARIKSIRSKPNSKGVYTANIEIRDGNQWKGKFSSFFPDIPDNMSRQQVVDAVMHAYKNSKAPSKQPWSGPSGKGFQISNSG